MHSPQQVVSLAECNSTRETGERVYVPFGPSAMYSRIAHFLFDASRRGSRRGKWSPSFEAPVFSSLSVREGVGFASFRVASRARSSTLQGISFSQLQARDFESLRAEKEKPGRAETQSYATLVEWQPGSP